MILQGFCRPGWNRTTISGSGMSFISHSSLGAQKYIPFSKLQLIKPSYFKLVPFPSFHPFLSFLYRKKNAIGRAYFIFTPNKFRGTSLHFHKEKSKNSVRYRVSKIQSNNEKFSKNHLW